MRTCRALALALGVLTGSGCVSGPRAENPVFFRSDYGPVENPVLLHPGTPGPATYAEVWDHVLNVIDAHFDIAYSNRYDGRIVTTPRTAPGIAQPWRSGSPDTRERLLASLQSIRHRCEVLVQTGRSGGYLVQVTVYKELESNPFPNADATLASRANLRRPSTIERQYEVISPETVSPTWIPKGRDTCIEQMILRDLQACQP